MSLDFAAIGKRLQTLRKDRGMKQKDFASLIGTSVSYVKNIENGIKPSLEAILIASKVYECSVDWILKGEELFSSDPMLNELVALYQQTPKEARPLFMGIVKTVLQNSADPKSTTSSTSTSSDGDGDKHNIA